MAYRGIFANPLTVPNGGTGVQTLTDIAVANGTSAFSVATITGTTNQIALANGSGATANPTISLAPTLVNSTQALFEANLGTQDTAVTGDGTLYTLGSGNAITTNVNQGSYLSSSAVFTAPVTGIYLLISTISFVSTPVGANVGYARIVTSSNTYEFGHCNPHAIVDGIGGRLPIYGIVLAKMSANDTATFAAAESGGTKTASCSGNGAKLRTFISGALIC